MDISSLLNPSAKQASRKHASVETSRHGSVRHRSHHSHSQRDGRSRDNGERRLVDDGANKIRVKPRDSESIHHRDNGIVPASVNHGASPSARTHKSSTSRSTVSTLESPRPSSSATSALSDWTSHTSQFSHGSSPYNTIQPRAQTDQAHLRSLDSYPAEYRRIDVPGLSRRTSAVSTSTSIAPDGSRRHSSIFSSKFPQPTSPVAPNGYMTSPDSLAAFASVAIADGTPPDEGDGRTRHLSDGHGAAHLPAFEYASARPLDSASHRHSMAGYDDYHHQGLGRRSYPKNIAPRQRPINESDYDEMSPPSSGASHSGDPPARYNAHYLHHQAGTADHAVYGSQHPAALAEDPMLPRASLPQTPPRSETYGQTHGLSPEVETDGPKCSYTENCTTGSPLRKVVSHIFGRNKLCTRQIPKGVWVHYCRKHYQRSRYRNPKGFALLQCDLVRKQVDRLQQWGGVADWIVKVRKREEVRLNKENAELAANRSSPGDGSEDEEDVLERSPGGRTNTTGSSKWLIRSVGSGKSIEEVLRILDRIEQEIAVTGSNFPDVEILPNVIVDKTRPSTSSSNSTTSHRAATLNSTRGRAGASMGHDGPTSGGNGRQRAVSDAQRKRKASSGASLHRVELPESSGSKARTSNRVVTTTAKRSGSEVKRQRMRDVSPDYEDQSGSYSGSPLSRTSGSYSPQRPREPQYEQTGYQMSTRGHTSLPPLAEDSLPSHASTHSSYQAQPASSRRSSGWFRSMRIR
ncbi:MAG: hypothetical protein M1817_003451 [Caeruleum heppii]|nr:MAG: hypothetical protein M1817_003451 [Caeruleum heppii]